MNCDQDTGDPFSSPVWYRIGFNESESAGFMPADSVTQWRSAMAVGYTNPGATDRKRVLMFEDFDSVDILLEDIQNDDVEIEAVYAAATSGGDVPEGVRAIEQDGWIDLRDQFYLMPVLEYEELSGYYPQGQFLALRIAALTDKSGDERVGFCDTALEDANECLEQPGSVVSVGGVDLVWVIDMTKSMQPYIDAVRDVVTSASINLREVSAEIGGDKVRFGLVGFRDDNEESPWLEFVTRNFTPELLGSEEFAALMGTGEIVAAEKTTGDFPEEVFPGILDGVRSAWREETLRTIILIGDASSHELGHRKNTRNVGLDAVKQAAEADNVQISAVLIGNQAAAADNALAEGQFRELSRVSPDRSAFAKIPSRGDRPMEESLALDLRNVINDITTLAVTGDLSKIGVEDEGDGDIESAIKTALRAAVVEYLGKGTTVPSDITAWIADRDPSALDKKTMESFVVMTRCDL